MVSGVVIPFAEATQHAGPLLAGRGGMELGEEDGGLLPKAEAGWLDKAFHSSTLSEGAGTKSCRRAGR